MDFFHCTAVSVPCDHLVSILCASSLCFDQFSCFQRKQQGALSLSVTNQFFLHISILSPSIVNSQILQRLHANIHV